MSAPGTKTAGDVRIANPIDVTGKTDILLASFDGKAADPAPVEFSLPICGRNVKIVVNVSVITGAGATITFNLEGWDPASASWFPILVSAGLVATGAVVLQAGPDMVAVNNLASAQILTDTLRLRPVRSGTTTTLNYSASVTVSE